MISKIRSWVVQIFRVNMVSRKISITTALESTFIPIQPASVAQLDVGLTCDQEVVGSNPDE